MTAFERSYNSSITTLAFMFVIFLAHSAAMALKTFKQENGTKVNCYFVLKTIVELAIEPLSFATSNGGTDQSCSD